MSTNNRDELRKSEYIVVRSTANSNVQKTVVPKHFQIGLEDPEFNSHLAVFGGAVIKQGLTGSLQKLPDGTDYLRAGENLQVTNNLDGSITIGTAGGAFSGATTNSLTTGNGVELNSGTTFNGAAAKTLSIALASDSALNVSASGLKVDISSLNEVSPAAGDFLVLRDATDNTLKKFNFSSISTNAQASVSLNNALTSGKGLTYTTSGDTYNNSAAKTMEVDFASNAGLDFNVGNELIISPTAATEISTTQDTDVVLIGDASDSGNVKKITIANLRPSQLSNALTTGDGLEYTSAGSEYNNSAAKTIKVKANGSTISIGASGISVASTPGSLTHSTGISSLNFNGSSNSTISIDTAVVPQLGAASNTFSGNLVIGGDLQTKVLKGGDNNDLVQAGTNVTINKNATHGTLTINATAAVNVTGLNSGTPARSDLVLIDQSGTNKKTSAGAISDLVDKTSLSLGSNTISVVSPNAATASTFSVKIANDTISSGGSGIFVQKVPSAISHGTGISAFSYDGSSASSIAINTAVIPQLTTANTFTGNIKFNSGVSGSLQTLTDGSPYMVGGTGIMITTSSLGQVVISSLSSGGGSGGGISRVTAGTGILGGGITSEVTLNLDYAGNDSIIKSATDGTGVTVDSSNDLLLIQDNTDGTVKYINPSQLSFSGVAIGSAEDGDYTDGLFEDFTTSTAIGTAVDRFNEILKSLAPSPASQLSKINSVDSGVSAKLSFDASNAISSPSYSNVVTSGLTPANPFSSIAVNQAYSSETSGNHARLGVFNGTTEINGILNSGIVADSPNYPANAFSDGNLGTLKLFVNNNSTPVHSVNVSSFSSGDSVNSNGSGFNLIAAQPGHFADGTNFDTFKHRTGTYKVNSADQRQGWNYARVVQTISGVDRTTNYIEWVNDSDSSNLGHNSSQLINLSMSGATQLSGVKYHTGGTATYGINITNLYKNVYPTNNITFSSTNCAVSSLAIPSINFASEDTSKILNISRSATINSNKMLNSGITVSTNVTHPIKSNLSGVGSAAINGILLYNINNTSTVTSETFKRENYRLVSGDYDNQSDVDSGTWNSSTSLSSNNGLMFYDEKLIAPKAGVLNSNFASVANSPAGNVDYSGITSGVRTFYRYFTNNTGGSKSNFSITINGTGTIISNNSALNGNKIKVFFKIPQTSLSQSTGLMDLSLPFANGQYSNNSGCLIGAFDSSLPATNNASFGVKTVANGEYILIKIEADATWSGNVSSISLNWS
jgi:hypothetical protein